MKTWMILKKMQMLMILVIFLKPFAVFVTMVVKLLGKMLASVSSLNSARCSLINDCVSFFVKHKILNASCSFWLRTGVMVHA